MKPHITILIFLFLNQNLFSQKTLPFRPFEPISFQGIDPFWQSYCYDENNKIINDSDGYNHYNFLHDPRSMIFDNFVINGYIKTNKMRTAGGYVECRSHTTGELIWQDDFGLDVGQHIEIPRLFEVDGDKLIVWTQVRRKSGYAQLFQMVDMVLGKRVYILKTGDLISNKIGDFSDPELLDMRYEIQYQSRFYKEGTNIRYLDFNYSNFLFEPTLKSYIISEDGKLLQKDTLDPKYMNNLNIVHVHKDTLMLLGFDEDGLVMTFMSPQLKTYNSIKANYTFDFPPVFSDILDYSVTDRKIFVRNRRNAPFPGNYLEYYTLNFDGQISSTHIFEKTYQDNSYMPVNWKDGNVIFAYSQFNRSDTTTTNVLQLISKDGKSPIRILKEFKSKDNKRLIWPAYVNKADDRLYLHFSQHDLIVDTLTKKLTFDSYARAIGHMLIDAKTFGIVSKSQDIIEKKLSLFPNPAMDQIHISHSGIEVYQVTLTDISGREVLRDVGGADITSLSTAHLPSGWYVATIWSADGKRYIEKIVIH